jgi:hypothetical protein
VLSEVGLLCQCGSRVSLLASICHCYLLLRMLGLRILSGLTMV